MTKKICFAVKYSLKNHDCGHLVDTIQRIMLTLQNVKITDS